MILPVLELIFAGTLLLVIITQLIIPLWNNVPCWPLFNQTRADLMEGIKTVNELKEEQQLNTILQDGINKILNPKNEEK